MTTKPACCAIIPARGGSKGIPRKNLVPLCGKPLIAWTIDAALRAQRVDRVIVSTDDTEIAEVAAHYGAEVVMRPAEISGDLASSEMALLHVLDVLRTRDAYTPELTVFLQCTSPLTLPDDIDGTLADLLKQKADSAFTAAPFHYYLWRPDGSGINHDPRIRPMRQEREPQFLETGAVYVMRTAGFLEKRHRFFGKTILHRVPENRCFEIDEPGDLAVAVELLRQRLRTEWAQLLPNPIGALVLDFDGVLTDNGVTVSEDGREAVRCSRADGMGLALLRNRGIPLLVVSTETNPVVAARCGKLGIECAQGIGDKHPWLNTWLESHRIPWQSVVYVGNDVNDAGCLDAAGCGVIVADACPGVHPLAQIILDTPGGHGAVRELADLILGVLTERGHD